jgi:alpha-L-rhamnosidase
MAKRSAPFFPPPVRLRCEYLEDPLGIDAHRPLFTWAPVSQERGAVPEAYQIIVDTHIEYARRDIGGVWDTGRVETNKMVPVVYAGPPLESRRRYYWRARWWDERGRASAWSRIAWFETGLFERGEWSARWIAMKHPARFKTRGTVLLGRYRGDYVQSHGVYFWRTFEARADVRKARLYVCGLGIHEILLNGERIGDRALDPAPTDYRHAALYSTYDITASIGTANELLAVVGNGRYIPLFGGGDPKFIAQIELDYADGARETIATDADWKAGHGPLRENGLYFGEVYDARIAVAPADWKPAVVVRGPRLRAQSLPPMRVCATIRPKKSWYPAPGRRIIDFGRNLSGWVRLSTRGAEGDSLSVRHAELLNEDRTLNTAPNQGAAAADVYRFAGDARETHEPRFTQHGFRYAEISGPESAVRGAQVEARFVHSDVEATGRFRCSHPLLNAIHDNVRRGLLSNLAGIPTDCPQRDERHGWLADARSAAETAVFNYDMAAFYRKFLRDIRDAQDAEGRLPDFVPAYLARLAPADPAWGSAYVSLVRLLHWYYGDTAVLAEHYEGMKKYIDFLARSARGNIIETLGKYGDWCAPGSIAPKKTSLALTSTWFYYHDTVLFASIADTLGRRTDAQHYRRRAKSIQAAFNRRFLGDGEYEALHNGPIDRFASQTANVLPLWMGMVPAAEVDAVEDSLLRAVIDDQDNHLDTGILGTRYLLDVLSEIGRSDVAYRVATQTSYPGWGYMIREGATSLWERWEKITSGGMNSHNHVMFAGVDAWLYKYVAGVRCAAPGWSRIRIEPPLIDGLRWAKAAVETIRGDAAVSWTRTETELRIETTIPAAAQARIGIPIPWERYLLEESGKTIGDEHGFRKAPLLRFLGGSRGRIVIVAPGGTYEFSIKRD